MSAEETFFGLAAVQSVGLDKKKRNVTMESIKLQAEERQQGGKGVARRLRTAGKIPAVFYGKGKATRALAVSPKDLVAAVSGEFGVNGVIELSIGSESFQTVLRDYQYHPVTRELLHADFFSLDEQRPIEIQVPLELEGKAKGIILGGRLRQVFLKLPVRCLAKDIPAKIVFDVSDLGVDELFRVKDLTLPEGVEVLYPPNQTLGGVYGSRRQANAEEEKAEEEKKK